MRSVHRFLAAVAALLCWHGGVLAQTAAQDLQALDELQALWVRDPIAARAQLAERRPHLEAASDPKVRRVFLETLIRAELHSGRPDQAREAISQLSALATREHDDVARVLAEAARAHLLISEGQSEAARTLLEQIQPLAERTGDAQAQWIVHLEQGGLLSTMGQFEPALAHVLKSLEYAARRPNLSEVSQLLSEEQIALLHMAMKNPPQALKAIDQAEQRAIRLGATPIRGSLLLNRGNVQSGLGHTDEALAAYQSALRTGVETDSAALQAAALNNIGDIHLIRKEYPQAEPIERQAVARYLEANDTGGAALSRANLGFALMGQGRVDDGAAQVQAALETMRQSGKRTMEEIVLEEFSRMYEQAGRYKEAVAIARAQQQLSRELLRSDREQTVAELQARFDAVQRERQIDTLAHENRLKDAELQQHRLVLIAAAGGTLLLLLGGGFILRLYRRTRSANAALQVARQQAEEALQDKNLFLATASHDLRQPIHAMSLMVEAVGLRNHDPAVRPLLAELRNNMGALSQLFNSLLDLSRLESGRQPVRTEAVALAPLIGDIARQLREAASIGGVRLRWRLPRSEAVVMADPVLLRQALLNLVHNAIRYAQGGQVLVGVRPRGPYWQVEVWDTGIGIAVDDEPQVFSPFYRSEHAWRMTSAGHGLGLAVVARSARLMGVTHGLQSRLGKGSRFWLRLAASPLAVPAVGARPTAPEAPDTRATRMPLRGRCLVLDDEPQVLQAWQALLDAWGVTARYATTAAQARAHIDQGFQPQAIFCDQRLRSGENGFDILRDLLERCPQASGALVSGEFGSPQLAEAEDEGYLVLRKPVDPDRLHALMSTWFTQRTSPST